MADLFTKAVDTFTFRNLLWLCGWSNVDNVAKPRCAGMHPAPAHDEPCRCLHFVEKQGDLCSECQRESGCRCYNGASKWDQRTKDEQRIPLS